ncbi:MAG: EF-hand domain-containing protein [Cyanobacteria bacterium J06635_10]
MTYFIPIDNNEDGLIDREEISLVLQSVGEPPLSDTEINFLKQITGNNSFTWNQFINLLLVV